jgi:hypothetical protein
MFGAVAGNYCPMRASGFHDATPATADPAPDIPLSTPRSCSRCLQRGRLTPSTMSVGAWLSCEEGSALTKESTSLCRRTARCPRTVSVAFVRASWSPDPASSAPEAVGRTLRCHAPLVARRWTRPSSSSDDSARSPRLAQEQAIVDGHHSAPAMPEKTSVRVLPKRSDWVSSQRTDDYASSASDVSRGRPDRQHHQSASVDTQNRP